MKVLLLGCTGNLGLRCIPALLAYNHTVTLYVRNTAKLRSLVSPAVLEKVAAIVVGDATNSADIKKAIKEHDIEGVVNVAGNQVPPWQEFLLPKIAKAVSDAAVAVGKERGASLRGWLVSGMNILLYPGAPNSYLIQDYAPGPAFAQHDGTREVVEAVPISDFRWSLICVAMMRGSNPKQGVFELLESPRPHSLLLQAGSPPAWQDSWAASIPWVGLYINWWLVALGQYTTRYEDVADLLAADLASGNQEWIGARVGMKEKAKAKTA